jgi:PKD repeat protein
MKIIISKLKKVLGITALCFGLNTITFSQSTCNANFSYTVGNSGSVAITNTSTGTKNSTLYDWHFGDGTSSSSAVPSHIYQYNGTYNINLSIRDSIGSCSDSVSKTITITNGITCNIAASFSVTTGSNGLINFISTSTNVPNGSSYSWDFGDGVGGYNQTDISHTYFYNGTYTVSLSVADSIGQCSNTITQTITVVNGSTCNLHANYTYTTGANGYVYFTSVITGAVQGTHIHWLLGNGTDAFNDYPQEDSLPVHYSHNGTYIITLAVGDTLRNCTTTFVDTIFVTNAISPPVCEAHFTYTLGNNGLVNFTDTSWGSITVSAIHSWTFGDGSTSFGLTPAHTYTSNGTYWVNLHIVDSSTSCSSNFIDSVIIINAGPAPCNPTVSFVMHKDSLNPQPGAWEISPNYSSQVSNAMWSWGDGSAIPGLYPEHTYATAGKYTICVMVYSSCGDSSNTCQNDSLYRLIYNTANSMIQVHVVDANATGIKTNMTETAQLVFYPNPSVGVFTLQLLNASLTKAQISISNILGEVVYSSQEQLSNNTLTKEIDLQNLANGAYFMQVNMGNATKTQKIIINK